jgi:dihydrofolate reductase
MRKIISFMHISLDGFVAGPNGEMNWVKVDEEIFDHVGKRISKGDTALYGRVTYQMMESYCLPQQTNRQPLSMILNIQSGIATFTKLFCQQP